MSVLVSARLLMMLGKIVLTIVPSMMTSEIAIEIKMSPTQRFLVIAIGLRLLAQLKNESTPT